MEQIKQLISAIVQGDQQAMQQFQQVMQDPQQGPQIAQAIQAMAQQGDPEAQQFLQMMQQAQQGGGGQPIAARLGAKLQAVKRLYNSCPEGFELKSFRIGGQICKKCMAKKNDGGEVKKKPMSPAEEYKADKAKKGKANFGAKFNK